VRVLHVVGTGQWGGVDEHVLRLALGLDAYSIEPTVVSAYDGRLVERLAAAGVAVEVAPMKTPEEAALSAARLADLLAQEPFDLLHAHEPPAEVACALAVAISRPVETVVTVHNTFPHPFRGPFAGWFDATYLCVSEATRAAAIADGIEARRTAVVHHDVDLAMFSPAARDESLRHRLGFSDEHVVFLTVARLRKNKGLDHLVEGARLAAATAPEARWLIVGQGREDASLRQLVEDYGLEERVRLLGQLDGDLLPALYASCDAHVLPALHEAFPIVNLEAMASGIPIVVSGIAPHLELVDDGDTGLVVPPRDPAALAAAMARLATDRTAAKALGLRGLQHVVAQHAAPRMVGAIARLYRQLVGAGAARLPHAGPSPRAADQR
jgi:glycosyltransferase involved in cell wall biosynthesis